MKRLRIRLAIAAALLPGLAVVSGTPPETRLEAAEWIRLPGDPRAGSPLLERTCRIQNSPAVNLRTFPSPLMRREFKVDGPVKRATAHVCGLGYFEFLINGTKVGDHVLDPVQTTYDKRACFVSFDVTDHLRLGDNAAGLVLGNGFFGQNFAFVRGLKWGAPVAVAAIEIEYADGTTKTVTTGPEWKATTGPILFDNVYVGETYDARLEQPGWAEPGFNEDNWSPVEVVESPTRQLIPQPQPPMRKIRAIAPVAVLPSEDGGWILDMGTNLTGWMQIRLKEKRGTKIEMRFAEHLMPDGRSIDTASTGIHVTGADQTDVYVCKGDGVEEWEPRFTYHGFRYVQVNGLGARPRPEDFTAWLVRTDVKRIGSFESSDPLLNKFYEVSMWTLECNLQGILTDCPHREKCAWMGDMHAMGEAASMNYDLREVWRKISADMKSVTGVQPPMPGSVFPRDKRVPANIAVGKRLCQQARPDWGVATVLVPWYSYVYYGDSSIVEEAWPLMTGWIDFIEEHGLATGVIEEGYGDWCPPGGNEEMDTPVALSSTALFHQALDAMARMADARGKPDLAARYRDRATAIRQAFHERFYDEAAGDYGSQTGTTMALHLGLVPDDLKDAVASALAHRISTVDRGHYTTGIHGHRALYTVLNDAGHDATSLSLWHRRTWPSLAFLTETHALTTWPEVPMNWPAGEPYSRKSFSHPMHGGFAIAFHESIGGIRPDPAHPGFKQFILKPCFPEGLEWAKADHQSPHGRISSHWKRESDHIIWDIEIPTGTSAEAQLPAGVAISHPAWEPARIEGRWQVHAPPSGKHRIILRGS